MHADIVQLRQHVTEINVRLDGLDDLTSDLQLEVTKVTTDQQSMRGEMGRVRQSMRGEEQRLVRLEVNMTAVGSTGDLLTEQLRAVESSLGQLRKTQGTVLGKLEKVGERVHRLDTQVNKHHSSPSPSKQRVSRELRSPQDVHGDVISQAFKDQPRGAYSQTQRYQPQPNDTQRDGTTRTSDGESQFLEYSGDELEISGDGDVIIDVEAGKGDVRLTDVGSGDGGEFFMMEEKYVDPGSGEGEIGTTRDTTRVVNTLDTYGWNSTPTVTPTPLTTDTVPTLTQAYVTTPTSPTTPHPLHAQFTLLQQRVDDLETRLNVSVGAIQDRLNSSLSADDVVQLVANETERLDAAVSKRDESLERVQGNVADLGTTVSRLAGQMASLRLSEFMERLQSSLVNFTHNVLTLEQWQLASEQLMNSTQRTQLKISHLASRVMEQAEMTSEVQMTSRNNQLLSERQYRLLQAHVIRLNNSLQDLQEHVSSLGQAQPRTHDPTRLSASLPGSRAGNEQQEAVLTSRLDDLALQLVYSDNRLSHVETRMLNASLSTCRKSNSDLYQDANLLRIDQHMTGAQRDLALLKETVKRLDLGLYRLHGSAKSNQHAVRKVQGQIKDVHAVKAKVHMLRKEVDNLLFQLPSDCHDYYQRGYRYSGDYVIYPRTSVHSVKVRCIMHNHDADNNNNNNNTNNSNTTDSNDISDNNNVESVEKNSASKEKGEKREKREVQDVEMEEGGWTVIQQRHSGKVNFTRGWAEYAAGFGSPSSEHWLGNEQLHLLTAHRNYSLAVTMTDIFGGRWTALYRTFAVSSKRDHYRLTLDGYHGNATDSMSYSAAMTFSTWDRDTDVSSSPCARYNGGGWWYSHCQISNLNGPYDVGMIWFHRHWHDWLQLRQVTMMIRPEFS
ncbi:protein scabrous-like [Littorina saxatilis]|uniref:protein scabrous-like n=1 Tax=Littorina saxatilis TaxID=31220 RepID=UPI0038B5897C